MKDTYGSSAHGTTISLIGNPITGIEVRPEQRGNGYANLWLTLVCSDADIERQELYLTIDPTEPGISRERLRYWYERHGFECMPEDPDMRAMIRHPKPQEHMQ